MRLRAPGLVLATLLLFHLSAGALAAPPPVEAFATLPQFSDVRISPGGRFIAAKAYVGGEYILLAYDLDNPGPPKTITPGGMQLSWVHWKSDERLLASLWFPSRRGGIATVATTESRLFSLAPDGSKMKMLVAPRSRDTVPVQIGDRVVDFLPDDPDHILMAFSLDDPRLPRLYRVNVHNDLREVVETGDSGIFGWMVDQQGRPRVGRGFDSKRMRERVFFKAPDGRKWEPFIDRPLDSGPEFDPVMFDREDPDILYVLSNHESDTTGLYRFRFSTGEFIEQMFLHPGVDVHGVIRDPRGTEIHGVSYITEESHVRWFDRRQAEYLEDVRLRVAARHVRIVSGSWDYSRMVIYAESPEVPGRYYLYEPETKKLAYFAHTYPDLDKTTLSRTRAVTYQARDGLDIPAYLTLPPGAPRNPEKPLPAVIFPHGGPHARDFATFDPLVQLMASRGYAVLQMNFRGSTGYGSEFMQAGKHQWGQAMQDDVTDGTHWLIEEGIADPQRICIAGWSYGGYAALMGAVKESSLYRCAVSIAGVSDLPRLIDNYRNYIFGRVLTRYIGDSWKDRKSLNENSPVKRAAEIRVPVLLAHGTKDIVVPVGHSTSMGRALRRAGKTYQYVELEDTDHSVMHGTERLKLFRALDDFLALHLGGEAT